MTDAKIISKTAIAARAINTTTRAIAQSGIFLTHDECDELGEESLAWLVSRLRLRAVASAEGVDFRAAE